jgi:hypothetical protein
MIKIDNKVLTKEMVQALQMVRELQESGKEFSTDDIKLPLTNLYSENLVEPVTIERNGEHLMSCVITDFGWAVLKKIDEDKK